MCLRIGLRCFLRISEGCFLRIRLRCFLTQIYSRNSENMTEKYPDVIQAGSFKQQRKTYSRSRCFSFFCFARRSWRKLWRRMWTVASSTASWWRTIKYRKRSCPSRCWINDQAVFDALWCLMEGVDHERTQKHQCRRHQGAVATGEKTCLASVAAAQSAGECVFVCLRLHACEWRASREGEATAEIYEIPIATDWGNYSHTIVKYCIATYCNIERLHRIPQNPGRKGTVVDVPKGASGSPTWKALEDVGSGGG